MTQRFEALQAPRVTMDDVLAEIAAETYTVLPSGRVTVCELTMKNGFTVRGESAVVFIENNVPETGREVARKNAVDQIWKLLGFRLREKHADQESSTTTSAFLPHQQRVVDEKRELDEKLSKLGAFLNTDTFKRLTENEQILMDRQSVAMRVYSEILGERIALF